MTKKFSAADKIGNIVANYPQTLEIFKALNIDFCCGGNRPLEAAAEEAGLPVDEIIQKLIAAVSEEAVEDVEQFDALNASQANLIEYIVNKHHEYLRENLPELNNLVEKIFRAHGARHGEELAKVKKLFAELSVELLQHIDKEEQLVFPLIIKYDQVPSADVYNAASRIILELEEEHVKAGDILKDLRKATSQYAVPKDGCTTFAITYRKLKELESDIFSHIHLENNVLIPRFHERRK